MATNNEHLSGILSDIDRGLIQLPEFQRNWTWDDDRIRGILASLTQNYPMGAVMLLKCGDGGAAFGHRTLEGVGATDADPRNLILDGQQRLTSMYRALYSSNPVETKNEKGREISRYYYLDINGCLNADIDRLEAVVSVPSDRIVRADFNHAVVLDLSTRENEYANGMFPLNIVFNANAREDWADGYKAWHHQDAEHRDKYNRFRTEIVDNISGYELPVIWLDSDTSREAVCKVFENVNRGGVELTVFDLLTATYSVSEDHFNLRSDWEACQSIIQGRGGAFSTDVMDGVSNTDFLTAVTLYTSYRSGRSTSCKRREILSLTLEDYRANKETVLEGYKIAREFLTSQCVFSRADLPYPGQLTPLAVICAVLGRRTYNNPDTQTKLSKWFWCGILGEIYGSTTDTRYANDVDDVIAYIEGRDSQNRTINSAVFSATRLLSLKNKKSAACKGILALLYKNNCLDFMRDSIVNIMRAEDSVPDIHHIFPRAYCDGRYPELKWDSIVNKTPLLKITNQNIGRNAPSDYLNTIMREAHIDETELKRRVESNFVNYTLLKADNFDEYFIDRAKKLIALIENAMGKEVGDKDSTETINQFGGSLR